MRFRAQRHGTLILLYYRPAVACKDTLREKITHATPRRDNRRKILLEGLLISYSQLSKSNRFCQTPKNNDTHVETKVFTAAFFICALVVASIDNAGFDVVLTGLLLCVWEVGAMWLLKKGPHETSVRIERVGEYSLLSFFLRS